MNQRKLAGAISILLLAILFIVVGCGDGRREHSTKLNRKYPVGKGGTPPLGSKEAAQKGAEMAKVQAEFDMAEANGQALQQLEDGDYVLEEVLNLATYMNKNEEFRFIRRSKPQIVGNQWVLGAEEKSRGAGFAGTPPDGANREIEVLGNISVKNGAIDFAGASKFIFATRVVKDSFTMKIDDQILLTGSPEVSIAQMLAVPPTANAGNVARYKDLMKSKKASLWLLKTAENRIVVKLAIEEHSQSAGKNPSTILFARTLLFSYRVKRPTPANAPEAPNAAAAKQADGPERAQGQAQSGQTGKESLPASEIGTAE